MLKRPFKSLIARIAIIALALSLVVPFVPAAFAQSASTAIDYAENGTGPVATFSATDEDGDPIVWSLSEEDDDGKTTPTSPLKMVCSSVQEIRPTSRRREMDVRTGTTYMK